MFKALFEALLASQQKNSHKHAISRHLAYIALYELKGEESLYPDVLTRFKQLEAKMSELGMDIWLVEGFRSAKKQNDYYAKGRTKPGSIITNAKGLQGYHQYGLAFDVAFKDYNWKPPQWNWWTILGKEGEKLGLVWGGSFQDWGHFEWHTDFEWKELKPWFTK